jgi:hypothetical protein
MIAEMIEENEMAEKRIAAIRLERKQLAGLWRQTPDSPVSMTRFLIQNRRKVLADELMQRLLNLGRSVN